MDKLLELLLNHNAPNNRQTKEFKLNRLSEEFGEDTIFTI